MKHPIHFIWIGPAMPDYAKANIERARALHPDRDVHVHMEEILWPEWQETFDRMPIIGKADLLKLSAARKIGGWVLDCDVWCLRPLDTYEQLRWTAASGWWGTASMGCFGADKTFDWEILDELVPELPSRRNAIWDLLQQWATWERSTRFDIVPEKTMFIAAGNEPGLYHRLISGLPTSIGTRLLLHGHRTATPIPDSAIL